MSNPVTPRGSQPTRTGRPPVAARGPIGGLMADLLPRRGPSRLLGYTTAFWLVSAVLHSVIFVFSDDSWSGAISWRKPIVFSLSIGLLLWSYGWILDRLPHRPRLAWPMAVLFAVSSTAEIGLIAMQRWRGRASHFNTLADGDALVFALMGALVAMMSLLLVGLLVWSMIERPEDRLERVAAIAGLAIVMTGLGTGQWLISLGSAYVEQFDRVPDTVVNGEAGAPKFPHAVAFHGIHVFMVAATLLRRSAVSAVKAGQAMMVTVAAYSGVLMFSALQTFGGRAPFDLGIVSAALLLLSTGTLVAVLGVIARWWLKAPIEPVDPVAQTGAADGGGGHQRPATVARSTFER